MAETSERKRARILLYDGGMGTTLEDDFNADISSSLWSSSLLKDQVKGHATLKALHSAFIDAGANLIQTCTYQSSFEGFRRNGYSDDDAVSLMRNAVDLAHEIVVDNNAKKSLLDKGKTKLRTTDSSSDILSTPASLVLALSCYGAILSPGQEYTGRYPPPYGSPSHFPDHQQASLSIHNTTSTQGQSDAFPRDKNWKSSSINALAEWHYNRLRVFASDPETWSKISVVAFETLPVLYEAIAIRKAMSRLKQDLIQEAGHNAEQKQLHWPDWWIAFVFPKGALPVDTSLEEGILDTEQIAKTVFDDEDEDEDEKEKEKEKGHILEVPTGIGINCTKMRYLPNLIDGFTQATQRIPRREELGTSAGMSIDRHHHRQQERWLVVYPDGGLVYDPVTKTWHQDDQDNTNDGTERLTISDGFDVKQDIAGQVASKADPATMWASKLLQAAQPALEAKAIMKGNDSSKTAVWDKIVLGGCCKASPAYISELSKIVEKDAV